MKTTLNLQSGRVIADLTEAELNELRNHLSPPPVFPTVPIVIPASDEKYNVPRPPWEITCQQPMLGDPLGWLNRMTCSGHSHTLCSNAN